MLKTGTNSETATITAKENKLNTLNNQFLETELEKIKSWHLLIDEKPSKAFINLKKRKQGYSNITKIHKANPIYLTLEQGGSPDEKINPTECSGRSQTTYADNIQLGGNPKDQTSSPPGL